MLINLRVKGDAMPVNVVVSHIMRRDPARGAVAASGLAAYSARLSERCSICQLLFLAGACPLAERGRLFWGQASPPRLLRGASDKPGGPVLDRDQSVPAARRLLSSGQQGDGRSGGIQEGRGGLPSAVRPGTPGGLRPQEVRHVLVIFQRGPARCARPRRATNGGRAGAASSVAAGSLQRPPHPPPPAEPAA